MPFEFYLQPSRKTVFDPRAVEEMRAYLHALPSHRWPDSSYVLFKSADERTADLPSLLEAAGPDYVHALVAVEPDYVLLVSVGDLDTNRMMYDFVVWCRQRWLCDLYEYEDQVEPQMLLQAGY
ncbi:MAG: hypothetical protein QM650_09965 [Microlunatus sp.]